jgi:DNA-binding NarL/FixJ family response regulator
VKAPATALKSVLIVADDLIWASRLRAAVERADAIPAIARDMAALGSALRREASATDAAPVIIDLNGRSYDGIDAVEAATAAGRRVLAVGQHEDHELRRRALDAGATRVFSYNKLFKDGPDVVMALLEGRL